MGAPTGSSAASPGKSGDVFHGRGACGHVVAEEAHRERPPPAPAGSPLLQRAASACGRRRRRRARAPNQMIRNVSGRRRCPEAPRGSPPEPPRLRVHEGAGHQPRPGGSPPTNSSVASRATGSTGSHMLHVLRALDVVVRLVLMPGRALRRARLLHQQVVVEEAHALAAHQLAGDAPAARAADELLVLGDVLPVAEVLDEAARVVRRLATMARGLGSARFRSMPRSTRAISPDEKAPRTQTAPSRRKSSASVRERAPCARSRDRRRRGPPRPSRLRPSRRPAGRCRGPRA